MSSEHTIMVVSYSDNNPHEIYTFSVDDQCEKLTGRNPGQLENKIWSWTFSFVLEQKPTLVDLTTASHPPFHDKCHIPCTALVFVDVLSTITLPWLERLMGFYLDYTTQHCEHVLVSAVIMLERVQRKKWKNYDDDADDAGYDASWGHSIGVWQSNVEGHAWQILAGRGEGEGRGTGGAGSEICQKAWRVISATNLSIVKMRYGCCMFFLWRWNVYSQLQLTSRHGVEYSKQYFHSQKRQEKGVFSQAFLGFLSLKPLNQVHIVMYGNASYSIHFT